MRRLLAPARKARDAARHLVRYLSYHASGGAR